MMEETINLTGIWKIRINYAEESSTAEWELVHHDNRVMGREVGGGVEFFLMGNVEGNRVPLNYIGMHGDDSTGVYELEIEQGGRSLRGHFVDDLDNDMIPCEATKET